MARLSFFLRVWYRATHRKNSLSFHVKRGKEYFHTSSCSCGERCGEKSLPLAFKPMLCSPSLCSNHVALQKEEKARTYGGFHIRAAHRSLVGCFPSLVQSFRWRRVLRSDEQQFLFYRTTSLLSFFLLPSFFTTLCVRKANFTCTGLQFLGASTFTPSNAHNSGEQKSTKEINSTKRVEKEKYREPDQESDDVEASQKDERTWGQMHNELLINVLREAVGLHSTEEIKSMIMGAKNAREVQHLLDRVVYRHHLAGDPLNGHGYRVAILQALTAVAPRTVCLSSWWEAVHRFRGLGFMLTRAFAAEGFTTIRHWLTQQFDQHGRSPHLVIDGIRYIRGLMYWCKEDKLVFDHVMYTRIIFLLTMIVSYMDRHNLYRSSFSSGDFVKRDGIVVEWVLSAERCVDFDEAVLQCDAFLEEVLSLMREDIPSRPAFNVFYRLIDYYFATDNVEKMLAVMEEAEEAGVPVAESSTAKLMQLSCALNHPATPALFLRWRVSLPQCLIATPDMSRLLFFFSRSGGGYGCPVCGEPFNHRNVLVYVWLETPPHQRNCPALQMGRKRKGELEECIVLPHNKDWSKEAWGLWHLSTARSITWGAVEWRGFLLCCMFGSPSAAAKSGYPPPLEAKALVDQHLSPERMDDFLRATYMRFLRHHQPHLAAETMQHWLSLGTVRMSPIALQEALMSAASILTVDEVRILERILQEEEREEEIQNSSPHPMNEATPRLDTPLVAPMTTATGETVAAAGWLGSDLEQLADRIGEGRRNESKRGWCRWLVSLGVVQIREGVGLSVDNPAWKDRRYKDLQFIWKAILEKDTYVMPYTKRVLRARQAVLLEIWKKKKKLWEMQELEKSVDAEQENDQMHGRSNEEREKEEAHFTAEQSLLDTIIMMTPRNVSLLDMKDSASDFAVGSTKKNVFIP